MPDSSMTIYEDGIPKMVLAADRPSRRQEDIPDLITPDATSGPAEWGRYHDAVREASRSFDNPDVGDIRHFLKARARHPDKVDAEKFHEAVRRQRLSDLVDIVDHHMRRDGSLPRGHRMVRVQAPRGYMRRALRSSSPEDISHLHHRLSAIGHNPDHVAKYISDRVSPDMWDQASSMQVTMSDAEFGGLTFDDSDSTLDDGVEIAEIISDAIARIAPPTINVYVDAKKVDNEK